MFCSFSTIVLLAALAFSPGLAPAPPEAEAITPFLGEDDSLVVVIDLESIDPASLFGENVGIPSVRGAIAPLVGWRDALVDAGADRLYVVANLLDMVDALFVVVTTREGADAKEIGDILCGTAAPVPFSWPTCAQVHGAVFAGTRDALERVRRPAAHRPNILEALSLGDDKPMARLVFALSALQRRVVGELVDEWPAEIGGGSTAPFFQDTPWVALTLTSEAEGRATLRFDLRSRTPESARAVADLVDRAVAFFLEASGDGLPAPLRQQIRDQVRAEVQGDQLRLDVDAPILTGMLMPAALSADEAARRQQSMNNLKQIGLAFHNDASRNRRRGQAGSYAFTPAYSSDEAKRPLLSWRVHLLPYIEQKELYDRFHLDEPWDSPHNRTLIAEMPETYASPLAPVGLAAQGKTTYVVPRGPSTTLSGTERTPINSISDGTSNTILALEVPADRAVVWTQPADWEIGEEPSPAILAEGLRTGAPVLFVDGAVRYLLSTIDPAVFRALLTKDGGEKINAGSF